MKKQIFLLAVAGFLAPVLLAQEQDSIKKLDEVVITATKDERSIYETGRSITVVHSKEIRESGALTLMDLLSSTEGININGAGQNYGSKSTLFIRGASGNHSVVMIDGVRLSDPTSPDNGLDLSEISLANIERIEIVRGSHSTIYGSSAIGGVVNIITKGSDTTGFHLDARYAFGTFAGNSDLDGEHENGLAFDYGLNLAYQFKQGFYVNAGILSHHSKGFNSTVDTAVTPGTYKHANQGDPFDKFGYNARLGFKNNTLDAFLAFRGEMQGAEIDDGGFRDDDNHVIETRRMLLNYGLKYKFNSTLSLRVNGGYTMLERFLVDDSSLVDTTVYDQAFLENSYFGTSLNNEMVLNGKWKGFALTLGANHVLETMTGDTYYYSPFWSDSSSLDTLDLNASILGFFAHADVDGSVFSEKCNAWTFGLGARYAMHSRFGNALTLELAPGYKFSDKGMIYVSFSTGFNAPSLYQLFTPEKDFMSGIQRGNPDLKPESSVTWELGIKEKLRPGLSWSASLFYTRVSNTIEYVYLWDGSKSLDSLSFLDYKADRYLNMGETRTTGLEFSVHSRLNDKLSVKAAITVLGGKYIVDKADEDTTGTYGHHVQIFSNGAFVDGRTETYGLPRRSSQGSLALFWKPFKGFTVSPSARYVTQRSDLIYDATLGPFGALAPTALGDYLLLDINLSYEITKRFSISAKAENLSNQTYQEIRGYASRGRGFYLKLGAFF